jgi:hypothetical protein
MLGLDILHGDTASNFETSISFVEYRANAT